MKCMDSGIAPVQPARLGSLRARLGPFTVHFPEEGAGQTTCFY